MLDDNGVVVRNLIGKKVIPKFIVTLGRSFIEGEALVEKSKSLDNYFDSPQRKELLWKVQDHHSLYQLLPADPGDTWVTSMKNVFQNFLFYYHGLKLFLD